LTVVWPVIGFCTSRVVPLMAAMVPEAPGNCRGVALLPPDDAPPVVVELDDEVEADEEDPHAARATPATPSANIARTRLSGPERSAARRPESATGFGGLTGLVMVLSFWCDGIDGNYSLRSASMGARRAARPAG
jgi:hypothetical protein